MYLGLKNISYYETEVYIRDLDLNIFRCPYGKIAKMIYTLSNKLADVLFISLFLSIKAVLKH